MLTLGEENDPHVVSGDFEDDEWQALLDFIVYAKDLEATELIQQDGPGVLRLHYTKETGLSYQVDLPPEGHVLSMLHRLRPFVLNNEATNFNRISKTLARRLGDDSLRKFLKSLQEYASGKELQKTIRIRSNETLINSDETLMKWLNAHEYHKDRYKQAELDSLHQVLPLETSRAVFIMMLYDKVRTILILSKLISVIAGKTETFKCEAS